MKVKTSDGKEFELTPFCTKMSADLRGPDDADPEEEATVECTGDLFQHIYDFMVASEAFYKETHKDVDMAEVNPEPTVFRHFGRPCQVPLLGIKDHERRYLDRFGAGEALNVELIIDVLVLADKLQVMGLSDLLCRRIAEFMRARRPEFIREKFHIPPSTPEIAKKAEEAFAFYKDIRA